MATVESSAPTKGKQDSGARVEVVEVESPTILARQAIGVFDSGSGGMVAAAYLTRILRDACLLLFNIQTHKSEIRSVF